MAGEKPHYKAFISREGNDKTFYAEIGAAWKVGNGAISIQLNALPTDGKLVLFVNEKKEKSEPSPE